MMQDGPTDLVVVIGVRVEPLPGYSATDHSAAAALLSSLPRNISHEGELMQITDSWSVTVDMMKEVLRDDGDDRDTDDTAGADAEGANEGGDAEGAPIAESGDRKAQPGQRRDPRGD